MRLRDLVALRRTPLSEISKPAVSSGIVKPSTTLMPEFTAAQIRRRGFEFGVPLSSEMPSAQMAATAERQQVLQQLHDAYRTCSWMSAAIGVIARTVTAGDLQVVPDADIPEDEIPPEPDEVVRLRRIRSRAV